MPGTLPSMPSGNAGAGSAAAGRERSLITPRARAICRPAAPMATAAAAITPAPTRTPRRLAGSSRRSRRSVTTVTRPVEPNQPPERGEPDHARRNRGQDVSDTGGRPRQGGGPGERDQGDEKAAAQQEATTSEDAGDGRQHQDAREHRADQDRLVLGAELRDRPLLDRRGRQVDDRRADREHGRGRRVGERGHEVARRDAEQRREDAVRRIVSRSLIRAVRRAAPRGWDQRARQRSRHAGGSKCSVT